MATIYGAVSATGWRLRLDYTVTQSVAENTSDVAMELSVYDGTGLSYNQVPGGAYYTLYDDTRVYHPYRYEATGWYKLGGRTVTVSHRNDGTAEATLSAAWYSDVVSVYTPASLTVSGTVTLPRIPRASTLTAPAAMTMGNSYAMVIGAASPSFTHVLTWRFGTQSGTVSGETWTPPLTLAQEIPDSESGAGTLTLTTLQGGDTVGANTYSFTLRCPDDMVPSVSALTLTAVSDTVPSGWNAAVKGLSFLRYTASFTGVQGSTAVSAVFSCGGVTAEGLSGDTALLPAAGAFTPTVTVTDSRGRSASAQWPALTVYDYAPPTLSDVSAFRADENGTPDEEGTYLSLGASVSTAAEVGGHNQVTLTYRLRTAGGAYGAEQTVSGGAALVHPPLLISSSYEVALIATDSLGQRREVAISIPTAAVAMHLRSGGQGAAFGKYAEHDQALELPASWQIYRGTEALPLWIYPVGSVYYCDGTVDPAQVFGGVWSQITASGGLTGWRRTQ
ncbi:MAG: hypothetical protein IJT78_02325 [Oscillospiraceae bacterium]|nr:hypothetical protein [Oscillospiraceae bacterium]